MTKQQYEAEIRAIEAAAAKVGASKESTLKFLVGAGILTQDGNLAEAYQ